MNISDLREDFPVLKQKVGKHDLIYFDSAATAQVPYAVVDAMSAFYETYKANVDRGIYTFAEASTMQYERARKTVAQFIGGQHQEIVFTSGASAGINTVALIWGQHHIQKGDEIIVSDLEHHSNFLPWQQLACSKKATVRIVPTLHDGTVDFGALQSMLSTKTKLVALVQDSNVMGVVNDISLITAAAHQVGAKVLVDAAQSVAHQKINVQDLGCDFLVFSGHKLFGPTGIGVLYISKDIQKSCQPAFFGGSMVFNASYEESYWKNAPYAFEVGTPPIAQAIGLSAGIEYLNAHVDFNFVKSHEQLLTKTTAQGLTELGFKIFNIGALEGKGHMVTFYHENIHAHDIAMYLDSYGIAVRAGNHCVQPYHEKRGVESTVRASFAFYNTLEEVEKFLEVIATILD